MEMFGVKQMDHSTRYQYAGEWIHVVKRLWTEQHFDHYGEYFRVKDGYLLPKPIQKPYPVLINAGFSPAGKDFSAREVDFNFISIDTLENGKAAADDVKRIAAREYKREIGVMSYGLVCCRDTEKEAQQLYRYIIEKGDWEATRIILNLLGVESGSFTEQHLTQFAEHFIAGWGGYPMIGTPEQIVDELVKLSHIGIEGMILCWLDYNEEIKYFGEKVLPLVKQAGLRQ
jgi:alkanesulfonate monooxygenase SsuD/methylene tetrahydromethanopterin reductase-like flavin-dependent oxidoreductase (luciferase family)